MQGDGVSSFQEDKGGRETTSIEEEKLMQMHGIRIMALQLQLCSRCPLFFPLEIRIVILVGGTLVSK